MRPRGRGFSFLRKQSFLDPGGHPTAARFLNQLSAGKGVFPPPAATPAAASAGFLDCARNQLIVNAEADLHSLYIYPLNAPNSETARVEFQNIVCTRVVF